MEMPLIFLHPSYNWLWRGVCLMFKFFLDRALVQSNFNFRKPDYPEEGFADEAEVDDTEGLTEMCEWDGQQRGGRSII